LTRERYIILRVCLRLFVRIRFSADFEFANVYCYYFLSTQKYSRIDSKEIPASPCTAFSNEGLTSSPQAFLRPDEATTGDGWCIRYQQTASLCFGYSVRYSGYDRAVSSERWCSVFGFQTPPFRWVHPAFFCPLLRRVCLPNSSSPRGIPAKYSNQVQDMIIAKGSPLCNFSPGFIR
jgi:hypothetical protein